MWCRGGSSLPAGTLLWVVTCTSTGRAVCTDTACCSRGPSASELGAALPSMRPLQLAVSSPLLSPPCPFSSLLHTPSSSINVNVKITHFYFLKISLPILLNSFPFCLSASCLLSIVICPTGLLPGFPVCFKVRAGKVKHWHKVFTEKGKLFSQIVLKR